MFCVCFFCKTKLSNPAPNVNVQLWLCGPEGHLEMAASDTRKSPPPFSSTDFSGLTCSELNCQLKEKDSPVIFEICITSKMLRIKEISVSTPCTQQRGGEGTNNLGSSQEPVPPLLAPAKYSQCAQALGSSGSCGCEVFLLHLCIHIPHRHGWLDW